MADYMESTPAATRDPIPRAARARELTPETGPAPKVPLTPLGHV